jgi:hypothetical protein
VGAVTGLIPLGTITDEGCRVGFEVDIMSRNKDTCIAKATIAGDLTPVIGGYPEVNSIAERNVASNFQSTKDDIVANIPPVPEFDTVSSIFRSNMLESNSLSTIPIVPASLHIRLSYELVERNSASTKPSLRCPSEMMETGKSMTTSGKKLFLIRSHQQKDMESLLAGLGAHLKDPTLTVAVQNSDDELDLIAVESHHKDSLEELSQVIARVFDITLSSDGRYITVYASEELDDQESLQSLLDIHIASAPGPVDYNYTVRQPCTTFCETFSPGQSTITIHSGNTSVNSLSVNGSTSSLNTNTNVEDEAVAPHEFRRVISSQLEAWMTNTLKLQMPATETLEKDKIHWITPRSANTAYL